MFPGKHYADKLIPGRPPALLIHPLRKDRDAFPPDDTRFFSRSAYPWGSYFVRARGEQQQRRAIGLVVLVKRVTIISWSRLNGPEWLGRKVEDLMKSWFWSGKPWQAFKNFALIFSFLLNVLFFIALVLVLVNVIPVVNGIAEPIVSGLNQSFVEIGAAHIVRTVEVEDTIPVEFDLTVDTETVALLTEPVPMTIPTTFVLPGGGGFINGSVTIELPAGTGLPVKFNTTVPVRESVPVKLAVSVDIPLEETELAEPFADLQALFAPLDEFLTKLPSTNDEAAGRFWQALSPDKSEPGIEQATVD